MSAGSLNRPARTDARPPMFLPFRLRGLELMNRVVVSPMAQYCAVDGVPNDWHLVHYGHRALGGAGLVYTEMTCVSPEGRISPGCTGLWNETQRDAWARIVRVRTRTVRREDLLAARALGPQRLHATGLGRAGPSARRQAIGRFSPLRHCRISKASARPHVEMTRADMNKVRDDFVRATRLGAQAGFDMLELHMAHGYLLASFLSPLTNRAHRRIRRQTSRAGCASRSKC